MPDCKALSSCSLFQAQDKRRLSLEWGCSNLQDHVWRCCEGDWLKSIKETSDCSLYYAQQCLVLNLCPFQNIKSQNTAVCSCFWCRTQKLRANSEAVIVSNSAAPVRPQSADMTPTDAKLSSVETGARQFYEEVNVCTCSVPCVRW